MAETDPPVPTAAPRGRGLRQYALDGWVLGGAAVDFARHERGVWRYLAGAVAAILAVQALAATLAVAARHHNTPTDWAVGGVVCAYLVALTANLAAVGLVGLTDDALSRRVVMPKAGWRLARRRLPQVAAWALVVTLLGIPAKALRTGVDQLGAVLLGFGWSALSFFVIPAIALSGEGPRRAMLRSARLLGRRWGGQVVGMVYVWVRPAVFMGVPGLALLAAGVALTHLGVNLIGWSLAAGGVVVLALSYALILAANAVLAVVLFRYAEGDAVPAEFDPDRLARVLRGPSPIVRRLARSLDTERTRRLRAKLREGGQ